jgi:hypothetical protein
LKIFFTETQLRLASGPPISLGIVITALGASDIKATAAPTKTNLNANTKPPAHDNDDFFLNLVDWLSTNVLGVGLGSHVYLWTVHNAAMSKLHDFAPSATPSRFHG